MICWHWYFTILRDCFFVSKITLRDGSKKQESVCFFHALNLKFPSFYFPVHFDIYLAIITNVPNIFIVNGVLFVQRFPIRNQLYLVLLRVCHTLLKGFVVILEECFQVMVASYLQLSPLKLHLSLPYSYTEHFFKQRFVEFLVRRQFNAHTFFSIILWILLDE